MPVNAPKCPFANQQRDGHMQMQQPKGRVAYEPSSLAGATRRAKRRQRLSHRSRRSEAGERGRVRAETFADHYSQARLFYRSQTAHEQAHIASALVFELSKVETLHVREAMVGHLLHIDDDLAQRVADGLALASPAAQPPAAAAPIMDMDASPALQIIGKMKDTLEGRAVGILITDGSDGRTVVDAEEGRARRRRDASRSSPRRSAARSSPTARSWPPTGSWPARRRCCSTPSRWCCRTPARKRCAKRGARRSTSCAMPSAT